MSSEVETFVQWLNKAFEQAAAGIHGAVEGTAIYERGIAKFAAQLRAAIDERVKQHILEWHSLTGKKEWDDATQLRAVIEEQFKDHCKACYMRNIKPLFEKVEALEHGKIKLFYEEESEAGDGKA